MSDFFHDNDEFSYAGDLVRGQYISTNYHGNAFSADDFAYSHDLVRGHWQPVNYQGIGSRSRRRLQMNNTNNPKSLFFRLIEWLNK